MEALWGGALRDDTKNGCVADESSLGLASENIRFSSLFVASHAGVFRRARFSSPPTERDEKRAPLKTPAWEATLFAAGDVSRETSPVAKSEEKRMFSQATRL